MVAVGSFAAAIHVAGGLSPDTSYEVIVPGTVTDQGGRACAVAIARFQTGPEVKDLSVMTSEPEAVAVSDHIPTD